MKVEIKKGIPYGVVAPHGRYLLDNPGIADSIFYPGEFEGGTLHQKVLADPNNYYHEFNDEGMRIWATYEQVQNKKNLNKEWYQSRKMKFPTNTGRKP